MLYVLQCKNEDSEQTNKSYSEYSTNCSFNRNNLWMVFLELELLVEEKIRE